MCESTLLRPASQRLGKGSIVTIQMQFRVIDELSVRFRRERGP
jgi:hypothetical protein